MQDVIRINQEDNVAVALRSIEKGESLVIGGSSLTTLEEIPQGHKVALKPVKAGEEVIKYGFRIGYAKENIDRGQWVHVHNIKTGLGDLLTYEYEPVSGNLPEGGHAVFQGFRRTDGKAGVRNEIWIIPTVGCVALYTSINPNTAVMVSAEEIICGIVWVRSWRIVSTSLV